MRDRLFALLRSLTGHVVIAYDLGLALVSFYAAYAVAYGLALLYYVPGLHEKAAAFTAICAACFLWFGVPRGSWRYVSIPELVVLIKATVSSVTLYTLGAFLISRADNVPRSVPVLTALFLIAALASSRLIFRLVLDGSVLQLLGGRDPRPGGARNVLVCGLTDEAEVFVRTTQRSRGGRVCVVGVLDDTRVNLARSVRGVPVLGGMAELESVMRRFERRGISISEIVVAEGKPSRQRLSEILELATSFGLKVSRLPDLTETASVTNSSLFEPKPVELGDLLGRQEVKADVEGVAALVHDKVILATGAGGSIGAELCRQIAAFAPRRLIITDSSEFHLYTLDKELRESHPNLSVVTKIMDVRDANRVSRVLSEFGPEVVFHAAALKHVPLVEENPLEGIKTNIFGTRNTAAAALANGAATFVMVSTDKAVNPTSIMGATKRAAETYCQALDVSSETTRFKIVRFGNVLGSNGSVVPRFQEQIAAGGPVTVTHPSIMRYFMTIPEAVRLVLHASARGLRNPAERGKIMVLDMGKPVRIVDLARRMIQLAGYKPWIDVDIIFTGLRPGEKLYEELFDESEVPTGKTEEGYVIASPRVIDQALLSRTFSGLEAAVAREDAGRSLELLSHLVPEYDPEAASRQPVTEAAPVLDKGTDLNVVS